MTDEPPPVELEGVDVPSGVLPDPAEVLARHRRRKGWRRAGRLTLAFVNLALGLAGLVFPVIQGLLHLMIGFALLAPDFPPARRVTLWLYRKLPRVRRAMPGAVRRLTRKQTD